MSEPLGPKEHAVLVALMAPGASLASAALAADVDDSTVRRYLAKPNFKAALREAQAAAVAHSTTAIVNAQGDAVEALKSVLRDPQAPHNAVVAASRTLLQFARDDVVDADMAARLEAVEASLKGSKS